MNAEPITEDLFRAIFDEDSEHYEESTDMMKSKDGAIG